MLEIAALRGEEGQAQYELEVVRLQEQMAALNKKLFGASSEKQKKASSEQAPPAEREKSTPPEAAT